MNDTWIKLSRNIVNHWLWGDSRYIQLWVYLLVRASIKPSKVVVKGRLIDVKRGDVLTSLATISKACNVPIQVVRTFLKHAEKDKMIQHDINTKVTHLTICNYERYQDHQHTDNTQTTHRQHDYKNIEDKEKRKSAVSAPPTLSEVLAKSREIGLPESEGKAFFDYWQDRDWKRGKKPMASWTASLRTWKKNCEKFSPEGELQIQIDLAAKCKPTYEQVIAKCTAWLVPANYGNTYFGMREKNLWLNGNQKAVLNWEDDLYFWLKPQGLVI